jgi:acyl carrier protein
MTDTVDDGTRKRADEEGLRTWLLECAAGYVRCDGDIQPDRPLADYGLDSVYALSLCGEIEEHLDIEIDPAMIWDHPTVDALTAALIVRLEQSA